MKKKFSLFLFIVLLVMNCVCSAAEFLPAIQGEWYDANEKLIFKIDRNTINGHPLVSISYLAGNRGNGSGEIVMRVNGQDLKYKVTWNAIHGVRKTLILDNEYYHTKAITQSGESVGGVYIGMTQAEVTKYYGVAPIVKNHYYSVIWYYPTEKWAIMFDSGVVRRIAILEGSTKKFDKTGLNASNSISEYQTAYDDSRTGAERVFVSDGECVWFGLNNQIWGNVFSEKFVELNGYLD